MKKIKKTALAVFIVLILTGLCSCSAKNPEENAAGNAGEYCGSWAYIHDKDTEILKLGTDGKAKYLGTAYTYVFTDGYIELTASDGTVARMKFIPQYDYMLLYEPKVYSWDGDGEPDGIVGMWKNGNLSFEFTDKGSYNEDGVFPGHYTLNEEEHSIKLAYNDHFADIYLYYRIEGNKLMIEYPSPVVMMGQDGK